ncbi:MAG TPA: alanine racemase, partial [Rectinemataceae bacterium]|nr:alanine racemase [Rectinemataceae bacterium]
MVDYSFVPQNISRIQERIQAAAERSGRGFPDIQLLAVTKFHPVEAAIAAHSCGIRRFGENRVQEAAGKYTPETMSAMPGSEIDLIGNLQSNKVNKALGLFDSIQSVDSIGLLETIASRALERGKKLKLYLELHTGEESKSGFSGVDGILGAIDSYLEILDHRKEEIR